MIRALLIDDEPLSIALLTGLLRETGQVEIIGTASDGDAALTQIERKRPEVLFVDVEMPGMDGFDLIEAAANLENYAPLIVFVTAFPQFAPAAFDTGAVDFVTKPIQCDRLLTCVTRLSDALQNRKARERLDELLEQMELLRRHRSAADVPETRHLWVHRRGEAIRLELDALDSASAEGPYVRLFANGTNYLHRLSVTGLLALLNPDKYRRVHRSHVVRIDRISSIRRTATGRYVLRLQSGSVIPVGRRYRDVIRTFSA